MKSRRYCFELKTNGIEAHVPFVVHRSKEIEWGATKGPPSEKLQQTGHVGDFPSKDGTTFSALKHDVWKAEALSKEQFDAAGTRTLHFVDPGVKNIFTCSLQISCQFDQGSPVSRPGSL